MGNAFSYTPVLSSAEKLITGVLLVGYARRLVWVVRSIDYVTRLGLVSKVSN